MVVEVRSGAEEHAEDGVEELAEALLHDVGGERHAVGAAEEGRVLDEQIALLHRSVRVVVQLQADHHRERLDGTDDEEEGSRLDPPEDTREEIFFRRHEGKTQRQVENDDHDRVAPVLLEALRVVEEDAVGSAH